MRRAESRRCSEYDEVHVGGDDLPAGLEACEAAVVRDLQSAGEHGVLCPHLRELCPGLRQAVGKEVAHGDKLYSFTRPEAVACGTGAAPSATHEANANHVGS